MQVDVRILVEIPVPCPRNPSFAGLLQRDTDEDVVILTAMPIFLFTALFIVGLLMACIEFGRRIRLRRREEKWSSGLGVIDGAVFGLMALLLGFSFSGAVSRFAGFGMGDTDKRPWLNTLVFAAALTLTVYTIIDLEFPRVAIIRVDRYDQALANQRNSMN